eukprot:gnl/Trimastix_PCT/4576.p1 GENE.gnl/Trimastix_PCT/4576~~gnl/Trimastix_PCT/4576.p1  ORF type:complete len:366 (-),score=44.27 gnl/Trimastix_PCT/4576:295-1392(-)
MFDGATTCTPTRLISRHAVPSLPLSSPPSPHARCPMHRNRHRHTPRHRQHEMCLRPVRDPHTHTHARSHAHTPEVQGNTGSLEHSHGCSCSCHGHGQGRESHTGAPSPPPLRRDYTSRLCTAHNLLGASLLSSLGAHRTPSEPTSAPSTLAKKPLTKTKSRGSSIRKKNKGAISAPPKASVPAHPAPPRPSNISTSTCTPTSTPPHTPPLSPHAHAHAHASSPPPLVDAAASCFSSASHIVAPRAPLPIAHKAPPPPPPPQRPPPEQPPSRRATLRLEGPVTVMPGESTSASLPPPPPPPPPPPDTPPPPAPGSSASSVSASSTSVSDSASASASASSASASHAANAMQRRLLAATWVSIDQHSL